jgi:hypothetical protein
MNSNASILSLITIKHKNFEEIIFILVRQLDEIAPPKEHWYKNKGKNAKAEYIWEEKKIKQWLVIDSDQSIQWMFNTICSDRSFLLEKTKFIISSEVQKVEYQDIEKYDEHKTYYTIQNWNDKISINYSFLEEESNYISIEGYDLKAANADKIIYPPALFSKSELVRYFRNKVFAVVEQRNLIDIRGSFKEVENYLTGFIQSDSKSRSDFKIKILSLDKGKEYYPEFNVETGIWKLPVPEPLWEGILEIKSEKMNYEYSQEFHLLRDFNINLEPMGPSLKDLYDRNLNIKQNLKIEEIDPSTFNIYWNQDLYRDKSKAEIELSERLSNILAYLSPNIFIFDPYLLGEIQNEQEKPKLITSGQRVFLNAFIVALSKVKITNFTLIGDYRKYKNFYEKNKIELKENYNLFFSQLEKISLQNMSIHLSNEAFHDRYWTSDIENQSESIKIFRASNSIAGLTDSKEFSLNKVEEENKIKMIRKFRERIKNSQKL